MVRLFEFAKRVSTLAVSDTGALSQTRIVSPRKKLGQEAWKEKGELREKVSFTYVVTVDAVVHIAVLAVSAGLEA